MSLIILNGDWYYWTCHEISWSEECIHNSPRDGWCSYLGPASAAMSWEHRSSLLSSAFLVVWLSQRDLCMIAFPQVAAAASNWPRCCCRAASWLGLSVVTCLSCAESRIQLQLNLTGKMELRRAPREPDHLLWDPTSKKEQEAQRWVCGEPRSLLQCCDIEIWKYESRQVLTARHLLDHRTKNFSSPFFLCDRCSMKTLQPWLTSGA